MREDRVPGTENLRQHLIVRKGIKIIIFDVTVPFENGDEARRLKVDKYESLATELSTGGKRAVVEARLGIQPTITRLEGFVQNLIWK